jgi:hypothetical protein
MRKLKKEVIDFINSHEDKKELIFNVSKLTDTSLQTSERWFKNNTKELLIYHVLVRILYFYNKYNFSNFDIPQILEPNKKNHD